MMRRGAVSATRHVTRFPSLSLLAPQRGSHVCGGRDGIGNHHRAHRTWRTLA